MRSATSFFNPALSKSLLRRFWPLIGGYGLIWALILPLRQFPQYHTGGVSATLTESYWYTLQSELNVCVKAGQIMAFVFGILFAMAMFSYLTSPRATGGMHTLPVRRETHYFTAYLTGLGAMLAVQAVVLLLSYAVMAGAYFDKLSYPAWGLAGMVLPTVWFYSFGVLCMIFTGQILAAPVFYGILGILPVGLEMLITEFAGSFLYGWGGYSGSEWTLSLSPIVRMLGNVDAAVPFHADTRRSYGLTVEGWQYLVICALAGAAVTVFALLVYKRRGSEETGTTVAIRWARPIFQYGVTVCAALALGQLLYELLFDRYASNGHFSRAGILVCMAAAGLLGFLAAEMLLKKSVRITKKGWRNAAIVTAAMVLFGFGLTQDLTGYEGYQPRAEEVTSVNIDISSNYSGSVYTSSEDPAVIRLALDAHRALIADKARQQSAADSYRYLPYDENTTNVWFRVTYALRDGRVVTREYGPVILERRELSEPGTPGYCLDALYNDASVALARTLGLDSGAADAVAAGRARMTGGYLEYPIPQEGQADSWVYTQVELDAQQAETLRAALLRDVAAGRGRRSLFESGATAPAGDCSLILYGIETDPMTKEESFSLSPQINGDMTETIAAIEAIIARQN